MMSIVDDILKAAEIAKEVRVAHAEIVEALRVYVEKRDQAANDIAKLTSRAADGVMKDLPPVPRPKKSKDESPPPGEPGVAAEAFPPATPPDQPQETF